MEGLKIIQENLAILAPLFVLQLILMVIALIDLAKMKFRGDRSGFGRLSLFSSILLVQSFILSLERGDKKWS